LNRFINNSELLSAMEKAKVYFIKAEDINKKLGLLLDSVGFDFGNQKVGVKLHFGEKGNTAYVKPNLVKVIAEKIKEKHGMPELIECCVLYKSERMKASSHIMVAKEHGFDFAPIVILDGENGDEYIEIPVNLKHFKSVRIGAKINDYKFIVAVTHFKGHMLGGFGGSIKNIGMGLGSRAGKLQMHSKLNPIVNSKKCTACGTCLRNCPVNAISIETYAKINPDVCIGCAKCIAVCPENAINIPWGGASKEEVQERVAEYAYGALKGRKSVFINFITDVTPDCDCMGHSDAPIVKDIGVLASTDIVALDKACYDLVCKEKTITSSKLKTHVVDKFAELHKVDPTVQLKYGEKIGLGKMDYQLVEL
jgi:uncharacterized Fe-S center protein